MVEIVLETEVSTETRTAILDGLIAFNQKQTGGTQSPPRNIALALRDPETGTPVGGLTARIGYSRMFVELLYVPDTLRGQGLGEQLMRQAEALARESGCTGIWLDTFSFQAPGFYKKLGYDEFGILTDYPPGFTRHYLHKTLS